MTSLENSPDDIHLDYSLIYASFNVVNKWIELKENLIQSDKNQAVQK